MDCSCNRPYLFITISSIRNITVYLKPWDHEHSLLKELIQGKVLETCTEILIHLLTVELFKVKISCPQLLAQNSPKHLLPRCFNSFVQTCLTHIWIVKCSKLCRFLLFLMQFSMNFCSYKQLWVFSCGVEVTTWSAYLFCSWDIHSFIRTLLISGFYCNEKFTLADFLYR